MKAIHKILLLSQPWVGGDSIYLNTGWSHQFFAGGYLPDHSVQPNLLRRLGHVGCGIFNRMCCGSYSPYNNLTDCYSCPTQCTTEANMFAKSSCAIENCASPTISIDCTKGTTQPDVT